MYLKAISLISLASILINPVRPGIIRETRKADDNIFPTEECKTEECYEVSKRVLSSLDETVNPCDDFYQFTCGGWINNHPLKLGQSQVDGYAITEEKIIETIRSILKGKYKTNKNYTGKEKKYDKDTFKKLKNIYDTCLNVDEINKKGSKPVLDLINKLRIYQNRNTYKKVEGLTKLILKLHNKAIPLFFDISNIIPYSVETDVFEISLSENGSNIRNKEFSYFDTTFRKYVRDTLEAVYNKKNNKSIDTMTDAIVNFEYQLSTIHFGSNRQPMSIGEFNEKYPYLDWKMYLEEVFRLHEVKDEVTLDTIIYNSSPEYFEALKDVLLKFTINELAYYAEWTVIRTFINYLSDEVKKPHIEFEYERTGRYPKEMSNRVEFCDDKIDSLMGIVVGKYFTDVIFPEKAKEDVNNTVNYLKESMRKRITELTWLDDNAKKEAVTKIFGMRERIGIPDFLNDVKGLYEKYSNFKTNSKDYFTNMINYDYYTLDKNIKLYKTGYYEQNDNWGMNPQTLNAYYDLYDNSMNFPAAIFEDPVYHIPDPDYMSYGSVGMVMGHEMIHAFDVYGRYVDSTGEFTDWWTEESYKNFNDLSECYINQYSEFGVTSSAGEQFKIDGYETLNENIADNGSIARAFDAWKLSVENDLKKNPEAVKEHNPLLPGLSKYSYEQLFYIAFGQAWCMNASNEYLLSQVKKDEHSPSKYRVNGVVMNSKHFAEVFQCPVDSPMNPKTKCSLF